MGESVIVNQQTIKKTIKPLRLGIDVPMLLAVVTLLAFGLIMVYSASWKPSLELNGTTDYYLRNQLKWALVGSIIAVIATYVDYHKMQRFIVPAGLITVAMLGAVLIFGDDRFNSRRSFMNGSIQPSELAKLVMVIYLSYWLFSKQSELNHFWFGLAPLGVILGIVGGLIILQPDLSAALTIGAIGIILFFLAGVNKSQILFIGAVGLISAALLVIALPTGHQRFIEYWQGLQNPVSSSFHIRRSMEAIVRGGIFGVGIGKGTTKFTGLPVSHTDSIFAVIAEETGLVGSAFVVFLFIVFLWRGLTIASRASDLWGKLLASGLTMWIMLEAVINMGVMVNLFPFAGNALPLISAGGSSLMTTLLAIGLIMNVGRMSALEKKSNEGRSYSAVVDLRGRNRRGSVSRPYRPQSTRR